MKKNILCLGIGLISFSLAKAQISGISASKLSSYNAGSVQEKKLEFEPAICILNSSKLYNAEGNLENKYSNRDSIDVGSETNFRITYGITKGLEMGISFPLNGEIISLGAKYNFLNVGNTGIAGIIGMNKKLNTSISNDFTSYENNSLFILGMIVSWQFTDEFSIDMNSQFQFSNTKTFENHKLDYFINIDAGYYVVPWLQPIVGLYHSMNTFDNQKLNSSLSMLNFGVTIEPAKQFLLVINTPMSIFGKNTDACKGVGFALTISLE